MHERIKSLFHQQKRIYFKLFHRGNYIARQLKLTTGARAAKLAANAHRHVSLCPDAVYIVLRGHS